ncbi:hypothetical protein OAZ24_04405 [Synechococcus sp. AH-736-G21]|nr:hypothetical protein [Synechococcus sp. AH-736-G21]
MPGYSDQASEIKEVQFIAESALKFFDSLVQCADQEGQEIVSMLAQLVLKFSTLSDEIDDGKRMNYGKLCVGIIINKILKDHREKGDEQLLSLREVLDDLLSTPMEKLLHMKI